MAQIGAVNVALGLQTAQFSAGAKKARAELSGLEKAALSVKQSISGMAAGFALGAVATGLAAAAKRGLDYASSLGEVAQQLGVTTRDLQVFRYAASQVGVSQEEMDKGLAKFTQTLGKAQQGGKQAVAAFAALGISMDQIQGKGTGEVIRIVADRLEKVPNAANRAAAEVALFGKAGQKLDTLLAGGSKAINELAIAAEELGLVLSDEQIQKADETADKLAALKQVLEARIAGVVSDNASAIYDFANALATLAGWAVKAGAAMVNFGAQARWAREGMIASQPTARGAQARQNIAGGALDLARDMVGIVGGGPLGPKAPPRIALTGMGGMTPKVGGGGGGRKKAGPRGKSAESIARDAERAAEERARALKEAADNLRRFNADEAQANADIISAQAEYSQDLNVMAKATFNQLKVRQQNDLAENAARDDLTAAQKARLAALINEQFEADNALNEQRENFERVARANELQGIRNDQALSALQVEVDSATTASERRAAELRLLDATLEQERAKLEGIKATNAATSAEYQAADARLAGLDAQRAGAAAGIRRNTMGPMESYLASLPRTAAQANEAMEALAANGISSIVDGLADAMSGARSLADTFKDVAKSIIRDLIRIQIQKAIVGFIGSLSGGGSNFGSQTNRGFLDDIGMGTASGGRALGGPVLPGRTYRVGERGPEFLTMGAKGHIIPNNDNDGRGIVVHVHQNNGFQGNALTPEDGMRLSQITKQATIAALKDMQRRR